MTNKKRFIIFKFLVPVLAVVSLLSVLLFAPGGVAKAEEEAQPYGIYTNIKLDIYGSNGQINAEAKNKFTLGKSIIAVNLYLYSSETYEENYNLMTLENFTSIGDLDQGEKLTVSANTNGRQLYWCAVMHYKFDSKDWVTKQTSTILYNADGTRIG